MRIMPLFLTACLLASFGCDPVDFTGLDTEVLTVSVTTVGANLDADGYSRRTTRPGSCALTERWRQKL